MAAEKFATNAKHPKVVSQISTKASNGGHSQHLLQSQQRLRAPCDFRRTAQPFVMCDAPETASRIETSASRALKRHGRVREQLLCSISLRQRY
jgi:hypothetical protein